MYRTVLSTAALIATALSGNQGADRAGRGRADPCKYCNGATDVEIREALACAAGTRMFSTVLNGNQIELAAFKKETDSIVRHVKKAALRARQGAE